MFKNCCPINPVEDKNVIHRIAQRYERQKIKPYQHLKENRFFSYVAVTYKKQSTFYNIIHCVNI